MGKMSIGVTLHKMFEGGDEASARPRKRKAPARRKELPSYRRLTLLSHFRSSVNVFPSRIWSRRAHASRPVAGPRWRSLPGAADERISDAGFPCFSTPFGGATQSQKRKSRAIELFHSGRHATSILVCFWHVIGLLN